MIEAFVREGSRPGGAVRAASVFLIGIAVLCNEVTLAWLFSPDGVLTGRSRAAIGAFDILTVLWAIALPVSAFARRLLVGSIPAVVFYLGVEVYCLSTGVLLPEDQVGRRRYFYEFLMLDNSLGYRPRPNMDGLVLAWQGVRERITTDEHGFRNPDRDYARAPLYFVGDSFVWGQWVPRARTFYGLIEEALRVESIALGAPSYGVGQYKVLFREFIQRYRPDSTVICIYANDLDVPLGAEDLKRVLDAARSKYSPPSLYERMLLARLVVTVAEGWSTEPPTAGRRTSNGLWLYPYQGAARDYLESHNSDVVESELREIAYDAREAGLRVMFILLPSKESVYKLDYLSLFTDNPESASYLRVEEEAFRRLTTLFAKDGTDCYDFTEHLREQAKSSVLYFERDSHWNETGHRVVAARLKDLLGHGTFGLGASGAH